MPIEYRDGKTVIIMTFNDVFGQQLAQSFRKLRWNVKQMTPTDRYQSCDLLIIKSARRPHLVDQYTQNSIPVFIYDWGYFHRVNAPDQHRDGHWQISYQELNNMPDWVLPPDRFNSTSAVIGRKNHDKDGYVLVCGQMPNDAAVAGTDHKLWLIEQCEHYIEQGYDVRYREHPRGGVKLSYPTAHKDLMTAMRGARFIVTYNSNVGHDALLAGIPVVCDPSAPYAELSGENLPSKPKRLKYFSRAAYGQWTYKETDQAVDFMINQWMPRLYTEAATDI